MNAVEIEEAVSKLAKERFDAAGFPYAFLEAFGNKAATVQRLKSGATNQSDVRGVLQRSNIHLKTCPEGHVPATLKELRESPATLRHKVKFILATDGVELQAESLEGEGETLACEFQRFDDHFGFFLPLAGISTVRQIRENAFDIKATGRLNRLYIELLKDNPEWSSAARREDLNHFMARLIFCFFAEDTGIFQGDGLFTSTVTQMSARDSSNTHEVISELFRAMNVPVRHQGAFDNRYREAAKIKSWANGFPYVNGGLFGTPGSAGTPGTADAHVGTANGKAHEKAANDSPLSPHSQANVGVGAPGVPRFSKIARSYLLHVGGLDWTKINPDIFGSMIQAVADDEERGSLGMHYTSVPNILKVLNPLFLDDLRAKLEEAGDNPRKLLNLRQRIARIRVFDPACGSGNFLVIAYKQMREIEAEINRRRGEAERKSDLPLTNFRGIEIRHFSCEIARLALIIAEYQCDVLYRGQQLALAEFLPLEAANWINCGNALRLDWLSVCPPTGNKPKTVGDDLFASPLDQAEIDFENEGGETYICGNPPYKGQSEQSAEQKSDMEALFGDSAVGWKNLDYVSGWFFKFCHYRNLADARAAFVSTNSICQGQQVSALWPYLYSLGASIVFARTSFKWKNLAAYNAGVTVIVVGIGPATSSSAILFSDDDNEQPTRRNVSFIGPYLVPNTHVIVEPIRRPANGLPSMDYGSKPADGSGLILKPVDYLELHDPVAKRFIKPYIGSDEFIDGKLRFCIWVSDEHLEAARESAFLRARERLVRAFRSSSKKPQTREMAERPFSFAEVRYSERGTSEMPLIVPIHTGEDREYLPIGGLSPGAVVSNAAFGLYDAPLWNLAIVASKLHLVWIATVCGKLETRYRYSNTLGWNTFPVPPLTEQNKSDLTRCAEDILLAREAHFPATIADLYDPATMPADLRAAHDRNDETLERIYIGRRFKNDTERLEKLFELYTQMTAKAPAKKAAKQAGRRKGGGA